ncbi:MAG: CBS domain-containing protein, partial [Methylocystis sp.]|nr:CBS domain-containing protein [Methylocystis sp.]
MNSDFPLVTVDADLDYVAKLLAECRLGAVPVVDAEQQPIGIVTRSNLEEPAFAAKPQEQGDIPPFLLRNRAKPAFHANGRKLRDVMTAPVVSAPSAASAKDIAKLMESRRLKRIPVVDGHRL